jgi:hypothetical protein
MVWKISALLVAVAEHDYRQALAYVAPLRTKIWKWKGQHDFDPPPYSDA